MDGKLLELARDLDKPPGADPATVDQFVSRRGWRPPDDYLDFVLWTNGAEGQIGDGYLALWPVEEMNSLNEEYAVAEFAPGLVLFGSDGGNTGYAFDTQSGQIVEVPFVGMSHEAATPCGGTLLQLFEHIAAGR